MKKVNPFFKKILTHQYMALLLRLYIGGLFVYASMYKINYPAEFAEIFASYQIIPYWAVNFSALVLPWVELICGVLLIAGVRSRSTTVIIGALLVLFSIAIMVNLLRNAPIQCGCFQSLGEKISPWTLLWDLIWLVMTAHIFLSDRAFHLEKRFLLTIREIES
ncbi:MAG: MauE/DoxX family redox-associated membrane protein [Pseudomonadota bacterium]